MSEPFYYAEFDQSSNRLIDLWPAEVQPSSGNAVARVDNPELFLGDSSPYTTNQDYMVQDNMLVFSPTPERLAEIQANEKQSNFTSTGPDRLDSTESNVEDITLLLAEMIGA